MTVLVTGATGLIGSALGPALATAGHRVVPLRRGETREGPWWDPAAGRIELGSAGPIDSVIHLAGETIAQRWTAAAKRRMHDSRVGGTRLLCEGLSRLTTLPRVLVCASATGFYGDGGAAWMDESSPGGCGFLAGLTQDWEAAAGPARAAGLRVVHARLGLVLSRQGGALARMLPVFRLGLGGRIGDGRQFWSWISIRDVLAVFERALEEERWRGPINVVAPVPVTSREFARMLGRVLRRPAVLPVPGFAVQLLLGEMGQEALLAGARVRPTFLMEQGFPFRHAELESALRAELEPRKHRQEGGAL